jgi:hypothetical protein
MNVQKMVSVAVFLMALTTACSAQPTPPPTQLLPPTTIPVPTATPTLAPGSGYTPEDAVKSAVEEAMAYGTLPYRDITVNLQQNNDPYATVSVAMTVNPGSGWVQESCGTVQAVKVSGVWKAPTVTVRCQPPQPIVTPTQTVPPSTNPDYYHLINRHTQMCLSAQLGTDFIVQEPCQDEASQQLWHLPSNATQVNMQSLTGKCVGYDPSNQNNKLHQVGCNQNVQPPWSLIQMGTYYTVPSPLKLTHPNLIPPTLQGGASSTIYHLIQYSGDCIDDDSWSHAVGQVAIHEECRMTDNDNQLWGKY